MRLDGQSFGGRPSVVEDGVDESIFVVAVDGRGREAVHKQDIVVFIIGLSHEGNRGTMLQITFATFARALLLLLIGCG